LLQCEEFSLLVLPSRIREIFLQETSAEVGLVHLFFPGLHMLLHSRPPKLGIIIQQICGKKELLLIPAVHHIKYFLTFREPCIHFIRRGFASELY